MSHLELQFSIGFDAGNYSAAYEGGRRASAVVKSRKPSVGAGGEAALGVVEKAHYVSGFVLGYWSSFELHEIPPSEQALHLTALYYAVAMGRDDCREADAKELMAATVACEDVQLEEIEQRLSRLYPARRG